MFATIAAQFVKHKSNLESDLRLHLDIVSGVLESIDHKVPVMKAMMELVFEEMQSPEEKEWTALAQRSGGIERFLESDELLKEMLEKQKFGVEKGSGQMPKSSMTLTKFKKELAKDVETILAENTKAFEQKFRVIGLSLREVKVATIQRQSDREIGALTGKLKRPPGNTHLDTITLSLGPRPSFTQALTMSTTLSVSSDELAEAAAAIQASQAYQPGKVERSLNTIGMYLKMLSTDVDSFLGEKAVTVSKSQAVSTMQDVASQAFDTLKGQVSHFAETSKVLVQVLDEVAKVHPFIQGVSY